MSAGGWLHPLGTLIIEASAEQAPASAALFEAGRFATHNARDERRDATVVVARRMQLVHAG